MTRYDTGTRIWTTVFGAFIAGVFDWVAVVNPARDFHPHHPHTGWWVAGLALIIVAPAAWLVGRLSDSDYSHALVWLVVLAAVVIAHWIPLSWALDQT